jgi:hypothetical protein
VAKALGQKLEYELGHWFVVEPPDGEYVGCATDRVPPYDTDVALAIGGFWTYLIKNYLKCQIHIDERGSGSIFIYRGDLINTTDKFTYNFKHQIKAKDYCEAICAHANQ